MDLFQKKDHRMCFHEQFINFTRKGLMKVFLHENFQKCVDEHLKTEAGGEESALFLNFIGAFLIEEIVFPSCVFPVFHSLNSAKGHKAG